MAVTKGHGNPDWTRDETILALDLYFRLGEKAPGSEDPQVIALSEELRQLPVHAAAIRRDSFRNAAGVAFKLQNFRAVAVGRGLTNTSKIDKAIWAEFGDRRELVAQLAKAIRDEVAQGEVVEADVIALDPEEEFAEGRVLTVTHRVRERSPALRKRFITKRLEENRLHCDCCGDLPKVDDPELRAAGFETHHVKPLAQLEGQAKTKLSDLALLCATCHRLIHRAIHMRRTWVSVNELAALLSKPPAA